MFIEIRIIEISILLVGVLTVGYLFGYFRALVYFFDLQNKYTLCGCSKKEDLKQ